MRPISYLSRPEVEAGARQARETLEKLGVNIDLLNEKNLDKLRESGLSAFQSIEQLKQSLKQGPTIVWDEEAAAGIQNLGDVSREARQKFVDLAEQMKELQQNLTTALLPESEQRRAVIEQEYQENLKQIKDFETAAIAAHENVTAKVAELQGVARANYEKQLDELKSSVDEFTEFQRRAFERGFDAVADLAKDAIGGQIKSWEDLGKQIHDVIPEIVADYLTLQLKTAVLGPARQTVNLEASPNRSPAVLPARLRVVGLSPRSAAPSTWRRLSGGRWRVVGHLLREARSIREPLR